ncbi:MAG: heavy metal sensor histidine kinase [Planctomycetales bacterium]|nr:heavy metal sensor histidine kinase [Planctomycetales bacterium]
MKRLRVRWRLTLWYGAVLMLLVVSFGSAIYAMTRQNLMSRVDTYVIEELREFSVELDLHEGGDETLADFLDERFFDHGEYDFQVQSMDGKVLFASTRLVNHPLAANPRLSYKKVVLDTRLLPGHGYRRVGVVRYQGPTGEFILQSGTSLQNEFAQLQSLATILISVGLLTVAIALVGGYLLAGKALSPVGDMANSARRITAANISDRLEVTNPNDELGHLAMTLNSMIDRLQDVIEETRRFTADAAHELRTPLAVMQTEAEVALRNERSLEEYREVVQVNLNATKRLARMADQLLQLSRLDVARGKSAYDEIRLDALVSDVVETLRPLADQKHVSLRVESIRPCLILGDDIQLSRVFYNVIENAIKYTPDGGSVIVDASCNEHRVSVRVTDSGQGIPASSIPKIFDRFYRADQSRSRSTDANGGSGLGLAIAKSIVDAHHGKISVSSKQGNGTSVEIEFPVAA